MENLGAMACSRYTGFQEITDRDVLELHCIPKALAHLQTMTSVKFKKDWLTTIKGVLKTWYLLSEIGTTLNRITES